MQNNATPDYILDFRRKQLRKSKIVKLHNLNENQIASLAKYLIKMSYPLTMETFARFLETKQWMEKKMANAHLGISAPYNFWRWLIFKSRAWLIIRLIDDDFSVCANIISTSPLKSKKGNVILLINFYTEEEKKNC